MSKQPRDDGNDPIPVLGFKNNGGQQVPFTSSSSNVSQQIGSSTRVVTLYSTKDAFIETHGLTTVAATTTSGHFLPATVPYDISMGFETAAVLESAPVSGTFTSTADTLLTQDGKGIELEHVTNGLLVLNHDAESAGTELITQDGEILVSQDNEVILTQKVR